MIRLLVFSILYFNLFAIPTAAQILSKDEKEFLKNSVSVIADSDTDTPNWQPLLKAVKNKKLILLGEFNHGAKQVFDLRNDLIRFLHERIGIRVILFESGIGEMIKAEADKQILTAVQMTQGLFGVWRNAEFTKLMSYIKKENISIGGFDVQRSGNSFSQILKTQAAQQQLDSMLYIKLEERYGLLYPALTNNKSVYDSLHIHTNQLIADYLHVHRLLSKKRPVVVSKEYLLTLRTISNRVEFLSYMLQFLKDRDWNKRWSARDAAMAANISWLCDSVYNGDPIIVIAHNYHIAKQHPSEEVMGEILYRKYGDDLYSMGIFAGAGSYADNYGRETKMLAPDSADLDIKHIISVVNNHACFLSFPSIEQAGSGWLFRQITVNDSFIDLKRGNKLVLANQFDGMLMIDKVSPPENP